MSLILIVDDSSDTREQLTRALAGEHTVLTSTSGEEALKLAATDPQPDLILLDTSMPGMDGYTVCRQLKEYYKTKRIPVIFTTTHGAADEEIEAEVKGFHLGAVDFIFKPVTALHIQACVRTHIALRRAHADLEINNQRLREINEQLTSSMERLTASEERFRNLVQTVPDIVYEVDNEGRFTFLNRSVEMLGYHPTELLGRHFSTIIRESDIQRSSLKGVLQLADSGTPDPNNHKLFDERRTGQRMTTALEIQLKTKSGTVTQPAELHTLADPVIDVEINSSGIYSDIGNDTSYRTRRYMGTVGVIRNITERKKYLAALEKIQQELAAAKEEAERNANRLTTALRNGRLGLWDIDFTTGEQVIDPTEAEIYGFPPEETQRLRDDWVARLHPDDRAWVLKAGENYRNGLTHTYDLEYRIITPTGEVKWVRSKGAGVTWDDRGSVRRMVGTVRDITARKKMESALIHARKEAEAANQAKGDFLANVSHEFRTPMNAIIGLTNLCLKTSLTQQQTDYLNKVNLSALSLMRMINDILDFSRIEAGKLPMEQEAFSVAGMLADLASAFAAQCQGSSTRLTVAANADLPSLLIGDPFRVRQILTSLVGNAVKFTHRGDILLAARVLTETHTSAVIEFSVRDTGIGMTQEQQENLFQDFFQADASSTRQYGGTGLGLAISRRLVELMGGTIRVESSPGKGSRFSFDLRLDKPLPASASDTHRVPSDAPPSNDPVPSPSPLPVDLTGFHILLVEDNDINQQIAIELLEQVHARVTLAENGGEAVEAARKTLFDAILMDVHMPVMDGLSTTRLIRESVGLARVPIIAMTANVMPGDRARCLAAGMDDYIAKPIDPEALFQVLGRWVRSSSGSDSAQNSPHPAHDLSPRINPESTTRAREPESVVPLPALPGVDTALGLRNVGGRIELYLKVLRKFACNQEKTCQQLASCLKAGDTSSAGHAAHTLKGVARTLGMTHLGKLAEEIETEVKRPSSPPRQLLPVVAAASAEFGRIAEAIRAIPPGQTPPPPNPATPEQHDQTAESPEAMAELAADFRAAEKFLLSYDAAAEGVVDRIDGRVRSPTMRKHLAELRNSLGNYDFETGLQQLRQWAATCGIPLEGTP
ncbi:MAG: response regulator [Magnetococcales bacterium]|nr:response regulator [Magnetococcales bacterium]